MVMTDNILAYINLFDVHRKLNSGSLISGCCAEFDVFIIIVLFLGTFNLIDSIDLLTFLGDFKYIFPSFSSTLII
jgi:hypothetical protein